MRAFWTSFVLAAVTAVLACVAAAQDMVPPFPLTRADIVRALTPVMAPGEAGSEANLMQPQLVAGLLVGFDPDSGEILPEYFELLDTFAQVFAQDIPTDMFGVVGHVDSGMPPDEAIDLSLAHAEAVKDYLVDIHGLDPNRFLVQGYGDFSPLPSPQGMEPDALNERIEFIRF